MEKWNIVFVVDTLLIEQTCTIILIFSTGCYAYKKCTWVMVKEMNVWEETKLVLFVHADMPEQNTDTCV